MNRRNRARIVGAVVALLPGLAFALSTGVPMSGLPSASMYGASVLPQAEGVVAWTTLAAVEPVKQGDKIVPRFSPAILALDGTQVRVQGFMIPMDLGDAQKHFLVSAAPPHCPFCLPAGPEAIVEVFAEKPVQFSMEPIVVSGKLALVKSDPSGLLYRMTRAEHVSLR